MSRKSIEFATEFIRDLQRKGKVASFKISEEKDGTHIRLRTIGMAGRAAKTWATQEVAPNLAKEIKIETADNQDRPFYFLARELRPGSGIVRAVNGGPRGSSGTLTCLLSSKDGRNYYFVAAGHVLTNFWEAENHNDEIRIHRDGPGFPGTNSSRLLGRIAYKSDPPPDAYLEEQTDKRDPRRDIAIVELTATLDLKQRTTCYGTFGEPDGMKPKVGQKVMKCGAEEPHFTEAVVDDDDEEVVIYGPKFTLYRLTQQVILKTQPPDESRSKTRPRIDSFAGSGDSGSIVVDRDSKRPLGMLIAGSVLDGRYVMTPFGSIAEFWEKYNLVFIRG